MRHSTYKNKIPTFFLIGIHSMQGAENHYEARSYRKKVQKNYKLQKICLERT